MNKTPENYPTIIYKYRSWANEYGKKVLTEFQLYLTSPKDFNDPFDCRIPVNFKILSKEEIILFAKKMVSKHQARLIQRGLNPETEKLKIIERLTIGIENFQKENEEITFKDYDARFGILSLSSKWDNILMWSHYGDQHYGYCVGFYEKALRESEIFGFGGPVIYPETRDYPIIHPLKQDEPSSFFLNSHNKSIDWKYENEYRLTKFFYPNLPTPKDRQINFDPKLIAEVIIGIRAKDDHKNEIVNICKANKIKVYQAYPTEFKFHIDRKEL